MTQKDFKTLDCAIQWPDIVSNADAVASLALDGYLKKTATCLFGFYRYQITEEGRAAHAAYKKVTGKVKKGNE